MINTYTRKALLLILNFVYHYTHSVFISLSRRLTLYLINLVMHSNQSQSDLLLKKSLSTCLLKIVINSFYKVTYQRPCFQFKLSVFSFSYYFLFSFSFPLKTFKEMCCYVVFLM